MLPDKNIIRFSQRWRCRRLRIFFSPDSSYCSRGESFFPQTSSMISVGNPPYATSTHAFPHHSRNDAIQWLESHVNNNNHKNKIRKNGRPNDGGGQFSCAAVMVTQLPGIMSEYKIWWTPSLFGVWFSGCKNVRLPHAPIKRLEHFELRQMISIGQNGAAFVVESWAVVVDAFNIPRPIELNVSYNSNKLGGVASGNRRSSALAYINLQFCDANNFQPHSLRLIDFTSDLNQTHRHNLPKFLDTKVVYAVKLNKNKSEWKYLHAEEDTK